jgi:Flp pilus assembly protein TadD
VAWASASTDLLLGFFTMACLVCYEFFRQSRKNRWTWLVLARVSAFLAMGSKETGVMIPLFLILREAIAYYHTEETFDIKQKVFNIIPFFVCSIGYLIFRYSVLGFISQSHPLAKNITDLEWLLTAPYILVEYLGVFIFPYPLAFIYDYRFINSFSNEKVFGSVVLLLGLTYLLYRFGRKSRQILLSIILFLIFILPALNLKGFSPFESILHDRYLYLPSVGLCILFALLLESLARKFAERKELVLIALTILIASVFAVLTVTQNQIWKDDFTLSKHALKFAPDWAFLNTHFGELNAEKGNFEEAERSLKKALTINENPAGTYKSLGYVYLKQGRFKDAETNIKRSIELGQSTVWAWNNLGITQFEQGKMIDAEESFLVSLGVLKNNPFAYFYLGSIKETQGNNGAAEVNYREALELRPKYIEPRLALANLLATQQKIDEAMIQIKIGEQENPDVSNVLLAQGGVYLQNKQCQEAVNIFNEYVAKVPNNYRAFLFMGFANECLGENNKAQKAFEKVIALSPPRSISDLAQKHLDSLILEGTVLIEK